MQKRDAREKQSSSPAGIGGRIWPVQMSRKCSRITSDDDCRKDQTPSSALGRPETRYSRQPSIEEGSHSGEDFWPAMARKGIKFKHEQMSENSGRSDKSAIKSSRKILDSSRAATASNSQTLSAFTVPGVIAATNAGQLMLKQAASLLKRSESEESGRDAPHDMCQTATVLVSEVPSLVADDNHAGEGMPPHLIPDVAIEALPTGMEVQRGALSQAAAIEHHQGDSNSLLAGSHREWQCVDLVSPVTSHAPSQPILHQHQQLPAVSALQNLHSDDSPNQPIQLAPIRPSMESVGLPRRGKLPVLDINDPLLGRTGLRTGIEQYLLPPLLGRPLPFGRHFHQTSVSGVLRCGDQLDDPPTRMFSCMLGLRLIVHVRDLPSSNHKKFSTQLACRKTRTLAKKAATLVPAESTIHVTSLASGAEECAHTLAVRLSERPHLGHVHLGVAGEPPHRRLVARRGPQVESWASWPAAASSPDEEAGPGQGLLPGAKIVERAVGPGRGSEQHTQVRGVHELGRTNVTTPSGQGFWSWQQGRHATANSPTSLRGWPHDEG
ncbi:hypothetical protein CCHR01_19496 [Colletotrichum chrysophilum]|uniref:Uncharacterized protein n=1 Tax=Colletotrichum chrysophilum TaxID=1836956 RepID=A0AAD8ZY64_9PEZI|nr:hypothetical protein CCHR01_19496 [Colletotrichum chrysophilum]